MPAGAWVVAGSERANHSCAAQMSARLTRIHQIGSRAFRGAEDMEHATTHSELHSPVIQTVPTVAGGLRIGQILNCRQFVSYFVVRLEWGNARGWRRDLVFCRWPGSKD